MDSSFSVTGLVVALIAGALGAAAWAALAIYANFEVGYLAWGIGALVGFATVRFGGFGQPMGVAAAIISVASIFGGKYLAAGAGKADYVDGLVEEHASRENYESVMAELRVDVADIANLPETPTDDEIGVFMREHNYCSDPEAGASADEIKRFRTKQIPYLRTLDPDSITFEKWAEGRRAAIQEGLDNELSNVDIVKESLGPLHLIFLFLGISTAFAVVSRAQPVNEEEYAEE